MSRISLACAALAWIILSAGASDARGGENEGGDCDSCRHLGLAFSVQDCPQRSSLRSYREGGYAASLAFGLNMPPHFLVTLNIYTGSQTVPPERTMPTNGDLAVGGAALEVTYLFGSATAVRPYVACGFGLYTYLQKVAGGLGYNGGGFHLEPGAQWDLSQYFAVRAGAQYAQIRFHDPVGDTSLSPSFEPFTVRLLGPVLRVMFFPSVLP